MDEITHVPSKVLTSLSNEELMAAYAGVQALMDIRIPTAVSYNDTGVLYDGKQNVIGRTLTFVWLSVKGEAVLTRFQKGLDPITEENVQTLASGIAGQFREQVQEARRLAAAHDSAIN